MELSPPPLRFWEYVINLRYNTCNVINSEIEAPHTHTIRDFHDFENSPFFQCQGFLTKASPPFKNDAMCL